MDKRKIAFLSILLAALLQLSHAETSTVIIGEDLEGPNVCKRLLTHNVSVVVTEMVPYQESKMEWCAQIPPRCRKTVIKMRQVNRTEVLEKTQPIRECCDGYKENEQRNGCVPHCQKSCGHGACVAPNVCKCNSGYGGPSCDVTCPPNFYGTKCKKKCDCTNDAECDPYSGECHCKKGYQGARCESTCTPDRYGEGCQEICKCQNNGKCNHISGECYCQKGYIGPLCEEKCSRDKNGDECRSVCRCQNGGICKEQDDEKICSCPPGWQGSVCANRCQPGFYGINCTQVCECFNGASCDHVTGKCICEPGFMGDKCLDQCPFNKFGVNCSQECSCFNGGTCDKGTGICSCMPGWTNEDCSERQCPDNKYGENCNETCECDKNNTKSCDPHSGKCDCKDGWTGNNCNRPCPYLKYGKSCSYQCDCRNNAQCSPFDGKCDCPAGFTGEKCDSPCPEGTYGKDCNQRCECKNGAKCSPETGECFCNPGWKGLKCERPCDINTFGQDCNQKCECLNNGACSPITGECYCDVGWIGPKCENKCDSWTFGQNCSFDCICERQNSVACHHQTGNCLCRTEYRESQTIKYAGVKCESTCPLGYYGPECHHQCNCKNNSSCDPVTGECFCDRGWMGKACDQKCPTGYFGQNCKERCPDNMPAKTTCDHVTGEFKCRPGYIGLKCDHACKTGTYGEDCQHDCKCLQGECHHVDGVCRCFPGWWGDVCDMPCPEDTWGTNCQHKCQCSNAKCRKTDGVCICNPGFMGPKCEEVCPEGFFGDNCLEACTCNRMKNFVCHPAHGCVCRAGWRGKNCDESIYAASTAHDEENDTTTIETFASMSYETNYTADYQALNQKSSFNYNRNGNKNENSTIPFIVQHNLTTLLPTYDDSKLPKTTNFTFIPLETTPTYVNPKMYKTEPATSGKTNEENSTKFTFVPLYTTTSSSVSITLKFSPIPLSNNSVDSTTPRENSSEENKHDFGTKPTNIQELNTTESSLMTTKSGSDQETAGVFLSTSPSIENVITTPLPSDLGNYTSGSKNFSESDSSKNTENKSMKNSTETPETVNFNTTSTSPQNEQPSTNGKDSSNESKESNKSDKSKENSSDEKIHFKGHKHRGSHSHSNEDSEDSSQEKKHSGEKTFKPIKTTDNPQFHHLTSFAVDYLNDRNSSQIHTSTEQSGILTSRNDSNETEQKIDKHTGLISESMEIKGEEGSSVDRSGMVWGILCTFLFLGVIGAILLYYRRRVANMKAEIGHIVRYMSDDPNRNFDNPVYSYQPSVNTDTSTLLHRHGVMNNLRQTRPSNVDRLNNFDHDSNSSGRAAQYSLQYDAELMNQKNHEADQTNPNFYSSIDDHLYDEIKLKCADLDMEYDHLDYSRPQQPIVPHYHRATSSTMSTLSQRNRESEQSNSRFPMNVESSTYDAPVPHPKKLNISVPLPPLPAKNINSNLTPSPSSSTASTVTQDDNLDAVISVEKPMNKDLNSKPDVMNEQTDNN